MYALMEAEDNRDYYGLPEVIVVPLATLPSEEMLFAQRCALYSKDANQLLEIAKKDFLVDSDSDKECLMYYLGGNENSNEETMDIVAFHHYKSFTFGIEVPEKVLKSKNSSRKAIQKVANFALKGDVDYEQEHAKYHYPYHYVDMLISLCHHRHITTKILDEFTNLALSEKICSKKYELLQAVVTSPKVSSRLLQKITDCILNEYDIQKYQLLQVIVTSPKVDSGILDKIVDLIVSNYKKSDTHKQESSNVTFEEELLIGILVSSKVTGKMISAIYDMKADNLQLWHLILDGIAESPLTDITILCELAKCNYSQVKRSLAKNSKIDDEIRNILADDSDEQVREIIAEDEKTSVKTLKKLASDESYYVRYRVARNMSCTEEIFEILVKEQEDSEILAEVYENEAASDSIREKILNIWKIE